MSIREYRKRAAYYRGRPKHVAAIEGPRAQLGSRARAAKREQVIKRDGLVCWLCRGVLRRNAQGEDTITIDHIVPLADGGSHAISNLRLAHKRCNQERGVRDEQSRVARKATA